MSDDVLYIPYDDNNKALMDSRKRLLQEFLENGWVLGASNMLLKGYLDKEYTQFWCLIRKR